MIYLKLEKNPFWGEVKRNYYMQDIWNWYEIDRANMRLIKLNLRSRCS